MKQAWGCLAQFPVLTSIDEKNEQYRACRALGRPCVFVFRYGKSQTYCAEIDMISSDYDLTVRGIELACYCLAQYVKKGQPGQVTHTFAVLGGLTFHDAQAVCGSLYEVACAESRLSYSFEGEKE
jgi:hypothetical protein